MSGAPEFPEPVAMTPDQWAALREPTDPEVCECRHEGLPTAWHLRMCPLAVRRAE